MECDLKRGDMVYVPENITHVLDRLERFKKPFKIIDIRPCSTTCSLQKTCPGKINGACWGYSQFGIVIRKFIQMEWDKDEN